jgi:predicted RecB family nuclease
MLGWPALDGFLWDYIRSKPPAMPAILKDGTLSQNTKLDSLPSAVAYMIAELEHKRSQYKALIAAVTANRERYFKRFTVPIKKSVVDTVFADFVSTAKEMRERHGKTKEMCIDKHCGWCDYQALCRAELEGSDVDYVLQREYEIAKTDDERT